jgi:hypothetical protein
MKIHRIKIIQKNKSSVNNKHLINDEKSKRDSTYYYLHSSLAHKFILPAVIMTYSHLS